MSGAVITGVAAVTPAGILDGPGLLAVLRAARGVVADADGARRVPPFDPEPQGEADWRRMSRSSVFAMVAALGALRDSGAGAEPLGPDTALVVGTRLGCLSLFEAFHSAWRDDGPRAVSPTAFSTGVLNAPAGHLAIARGIRGPCHSLVGGEAVGAEAVAVADDLLAAGVVRRVVVVGVEECPPLLVTALRIACVAPPRGRLRPSEGAIALVLEREAGAGAGSGRGAHARLAAIRLEEAPRGPRAERAHAALVGEVCSTAGGPPRLIVATGRGGAPSAREARALDATCRGVPRLAIGPVLGDAPACASLATIAAAAVAAREAGPVLASAPAPSGASVAALLVPD